MREARDEADVAAAQALRVRVFCDEQGVRRDEELDEFEDSATHVIALDETGVVATCRLREIDAGVKLERMAVERRLRGLGAGARLLIEAERLARERGAERMILHAQTRAEGFYGGQGYEAEGERFDEAGIEHVRMTKAL